jgi:hypothetical protein
MIDLILQIVQIKVKYTEEKWSVYQNWQKDFKKHSLKNLPTPSIHGQNGL